MKNFVLIALTCSALVSCGTQKRMTATRNEVAEIKEKQETENNRISGISNYSINKIDEGKIDSNVSSRIAVLLEKYRNEAAFTQKSLLAIDSLLANKKSFRKNYTSYIQPLLDSLKKRNIGYNDRLSVYKMVEDGLNVANYELFDLAAFFGPGVYTIPDDKAEMTRASFAPIIDSIIVFANKYKDRSQKASLIILGFADGAGFSNEGPLYDTLISIIGRKEVSKEELNKKLSELRAFELSKQIARIFAEKSGALINNKNLQVEYIYQGKGEELPFSHIKDYTVDDERRRIVLCYWVVLPN